MDKACDVTDINATGGTHDVQTAMIAKCLILMSVLIKNKQITMK